RVMTHIVHNLADGPGQLTPDALAGLVGMEDKGELTATQAQRGLAVFGAARLPGFFVGQVMKATQGRADGKAVTQLLHSRKA
nr:hypothetical protein [Acidimicrobiia bacterium]